MESKLQGTYEEPYLNFSGAYSNYEASTYTENIFVIYPDNAIEDIASLKTISKNLSIISNDFISLTNEKSKLIIQNQGSFLIKSYFKITNFFLMFNACNIDTFIMLEENTTLFMEVHYFLFIYFIIIIKRA